jgi:hypothetical protein
MRTELAEALDKCLARLREGDSIDGCIRDHRELGSELGTLLDTASLVSNAPRVTASRKFREESRARVIARIRERQVKARMSNIHGKWVMSRAVERWGDAVLRVFSGRNLVVIPVTLLVLLAIGTGLFVAAILTTSAPQSTLVSNCTLSVLSGQVEVQRQGSSDWERAGDGVILEAGSRVRTSSDSHALLTFFEGSSIKLEAGTELEIEQVRSVAGRGAEIVIKQWLGKTWSRVVERVGPTSRYEIETPSVHALVRGTLFETIVDETAATIIRTIEGVVSVVAQDEEVQVSEGHEVRVELGAAPPQPRRIAVESELVITVTGPAVASVCDPTGSSTGYLPDGIEFNQISGSRSTLAEDAQVIEIAEPMAGQYKLVLRCIADGTSQVIFQAFSGGETVFMHTSTYEVEDGSEWLLKFDVDIDDGCLTGVTVGSVKPLEGQAPEKIVIVKTQGDSQQTVETPFVTPVQPYASTAGYNLEVKGSTGGIVTEPGVGTFFFEAGKSVRISARPDKGWEFDSWIGEVADPSAPTTTVTMNKDQVVTPRFAKTCILVILKNGGGSVTSPGEGVFCYRTGATAELSAKADAGWRFDRWIGNVADPFSPTTTVTMSESEVVTANFVAVR